MLILELARKNYERGLWTKEMLKSMVNKPSVTFTEADYKELTGEDI